MRKLPILLFFISLIVSVPLLAQENKSVNDTVPQVDTYGVRVGIDLPKLVRSFIEKDYRGFEVSGDVRITRKFYAAGEFGNERKVWEEPYVSAKASGSYIKLGFDFNAYENWKGMDNAISLGLRYGFATFKEDMMYYRVYTSNPVFPSEIVYDTSEFSGLNAHWAEFILSIKTEIFKNLYLSLDAQLKLQLSEKAPDNFANLYIPGFNRTYDYSKFGVGYGYALSYRIPIVRKSRQ